MPAEPARADRLVHPDQPAGPGSAAAERGRLRLRVCSALILAPLPVAAIWFGGAVAGIADGARRGGHGVGVGAAVSRRGRPPGARVAGRGRAGRSRSGSDRDRRVGRGRACRRRRHCRCRDRLWGGAQRRSARASLHLGRAARADRTRMGRAWGAVGGVALHLPLVAGAPGGGRPDDVAVALGGGLGDRYRRLCDRPRRWRPAPGAAAEPAQDLVGVCRRRSPARRSPAGQPR